MRVKYYNSNKNTNFCHILTFMLFALTVNFIKKIHNKDKNVFKDTQGLKNVLCVCCTGVLVTGQTHRKY